jgi:hypothetical protein
MDIKHIIIGGVVIAVVAFGFGRYSVNQPTITQSEQIKEKEVQHVDTKQDVKKVTTIVKKPDGEETTTITEDSNTDTKDNTNTLTNENLQTKTEAAAHDTLNLSALAGINYQQPQQGLIYGVSVTKELIGPITIGAFGFTNGLVGGSIGISF